MKTQHKPVVLVVALSISLFALSRDAHSAETQEILNEIRKVCSGGYGTLAEGERAKIKYKDKELEISAGNKIFRSDEAGVFSKEIKINFDQYTQCIKEMAEFFGVKKN